MGIPVLDLSDALEPGAARSNEVAQQMRAAAMASGFFYVRNHGVPQALVQRQFGLAQRLMDLPVATREAQAAHLSPTMRGFEIMGTQTLDLAARPDVKESFYCGMAYPDDHPYVRAGYQTYGHNQWPADLPDAPAMCEEYIQTLLALSRRLMQLMALSLGLPESYFDHTSENPMLTLRMIRYPAHPEGADERTFGAGAHTDWVPSPCWRKTPTAGWRYRCPTVPGCPPHRWKDALWSTWATWFRAGPTACTTPTPTACATCIRVARRVTPYPSSTSPTTWPASCLCRAHWHLARHHFLRRVLPVNTCARCTSRPTRPPWHPQTKCLRNTPGCTCTRPCGTKHRGWQWR